MKSLYSLLFLVFMVFTNACQSTKNMQKLDIQGHRGCRGLMPENTIPAFLKALDVGVNTLELDVVISQDKKVVVSHEPYFSHEIALNPDGTEINVQNEKALNLYRMDYAQIAAFDCGSKMHLRFPNQNKMKVSKPLLSEMIDEVEKYLKERNLPAVDYNAEIKSLPQYDRAYHPEPAEFVDLVYEVLKQKGLLKRVTIQSFDIRNLQYLKKKDKNIRIALLIENDPDFEKNIKELGFKPDIYSPNFKLVSAELIKYGKKKGIKITPWTVNEVADMQKLVEMGVDGIITDYPDRAKIIKR